MYIKQRDFPEEEESKKRNNNKAEKTITKTGTDKRNF